MRIQHLFYRLMGSKKSIEQPPTTSSASDAHAPDTPVLTLDRLELQCAVIHHLEWCVLFNEHLSVDAQQARHITPLPEADQSELGRWLERMAGTDATLQHQSLKAIDQEHRELHRLASQALGLARQGRMDLASTLLNTDFERSRARLLDMLRQLQKG